MNRKLRVLASVAVLLVAADIAAALELQVDIGATGQVVKAGWTEWSEPRLDPGPPSAQKVFGDVAVTLTQTGGNGLAFRNGTGGELTADLVCVDNGVGNVTISMTISGLAPGDYIITTYHNYIFDTAAILDIKVNGVLKVSGLAATVRVANDALAASATFEFTSSDSNDVIEFASTNGANVPLNGFRLLKKVPTMGFVSAASSGFEYVSPAVLEIVLHDREEGQTYTVDYAVTAGTATGGGVDYSLIGTCDCDFDNSSRVDFRDIAELAQNWLSQAPLNIADLTDDNNVNLGDYAVCAWEWGDICDSNHIIFRPGQTTKKIRFGIMADLLTEGDETIIVGLSNPTGPDATLGAVTQHTYTIVESQPSVAFETSTGLGAESTTPATIAVSLSHIWSETVTVQYAMGGTATGGGVDYNDLTGGTLQFDPGQVTNYINIDIVDDNETEPDETIILTLFNPVNAGLGAITQHTYTIYDDETGVTWDGLTWYYTDFIAGPFVNELGQLEWDPDKGGQFVTRIPTQDFSNPGDKVEIAYWWLTDGNTPCNNVDDCYSCPRCTGDIRCISGTSDFRAGLFEADGEYIEHDVYDVKNDVFAGYKGYNFRFGPNMRAYPTRWVDCDDEVHKTGNFAKKPVDSSNLMTTNDGLMEYIPGFELPPGEWSLWTISIERTSSSSVRLSITLNGTTYTDTDDSGSDQPQKIDVFGIHMRNGRDYHRLVLDRVP